MRKLLAGGLKVSTSLQTSCLCL